MLLLWAFILAISLILLSKSANYLVKYSEKLGLAFGLSSFVIGASIVAIGTSAPELFASMFAVLSSGVTEFVADAVIGSNIANAMLVLGVGAIYAKTLRVKTSLIDITLPFFFSSMALFVYFFWDGILTRWEGVVLLIFFLIYIIYSIKASKEPQTIKEDKEELKDLKEQFANNQHKKGFYFKKAVPYLKYLLYISISIAMLSLSAKYLIESVLEISSLLGISSSILTITVVSLGTSLPEMITSLAAIKIGNHGIAIGNVFGSNIFNITLIAGLPALFTNLRIDASTFVIGLPFLVIATLMAIFVTVDDKARSWEGMAMLLLYSVFLLKIIYLI
jgi:cation:H+ antiporter